MKSLLFILGIIVMFGCCSSRISTQYITSGVIIMPNYTRLVKVDGTYCCVDTIIQDPEPGYMFSKDLLIPITITGYDCYKNIRTIEFNMQTLGK